MANIFNLTVDQERLKSFDLSRPQLYSSQMNKFNSAPKFTIEQTPNFSQDDHVQKFIKHEENQMTDIVERKFSSLQGKTVVPPKDIQEITSMTYYVDQNSKHTRQNSQPVPAPKLVRVQQIIDNDYSYHRFSWSDSQDFEISGQTAKNTVSQWRSIQGKQQMKKGGKYYFRYQILQKCNKMYFGIAQKLTQYSLTKGNNKNQYGVYIGINTNSKNLQMSVNGIETMALKEINFQENDKIGIKIDTFKGLISFDINSVELKQCYNDVYLREHDFYPTIDVGRAEIQILGPPKSLIEPKKVVSEILHPETIKNLQKVEKIRKIMKNDEKFKQMAQRILINKNSLNQIMKNELPILDCSYIYNSKNFQNCYQTESAYQNDQLLVQILTLQDKILLLKAAIQQMNSNGINSEKIQIFSKVRNNFCKNLVANILQFPLNLSGEEQINLTTLYGEFTPKIKLVQIKLYEIQLQLMLINKDTFWSLVRNIEMTPNITSVATSQIMTENAFIPVNLLEKQDQYSMTEQSQVQFKTRNIENLKHSTENDQIYISNENSQIRAQVEIQDFDTQTEQNCLCVTKSLFESANHAISLDTEVEKSESEFSFNAFIKLI